MIFFGVLLIFVYLALVLQVFLSPLSWMHEARIFLMPIIFFYGALALPYGGMLVLAFVCGFLWDALTVQIIDSYVEVSLGWSILLYALLGSIMSGFRPMFQRGRWEVHCLLSGFFTSFIVLAEYLIITIRRGGIYFNSEVWWRIIGAGLVAAIVAPALFFFFNWLAPHLGYQPMPAKKKLR